MADFQVTTRPQKPPGKSRASRLSTRIDLTPMVDLGFLLITFFMLTTVLSKPQVMPLAMPDNKGLPSPLKQSKVLTLLLGANDQVYWYEGMEYEKIDSTAFDSDGLRQVLLKKIEKVEAQWGLQPYNDIKTGALLHGSHLNVIIKAGPAARYKNLVDALDEMAICRVRHYCLLDISDEEVRRIQ